MLLDFSVYLKSSGPLFLHLRHISTDRLIVRNSQTMPEAVRERRLKTLHALNQVSPKRFEGDVEVIAHQTMRVNQPTAAFRSPAICAQGIPECFSIKSPGS